MTSEEIIQRLLDEKKISAKEAMIMLKDLAIIGINQIFPITKSTKRIYPNTTVVMYGVSPIEYDNSNWTYNTTETTKSNFD